MDVKVKGNVKHNGKYYESGETIKKLKKEDGERLIKIGVAESTEDKDESGKGNEDPGAGGSGE